MAAIKYDLYIEQGATYIKSLTWYDPPPSPNPTNLKHGNPKNLTGYTAKLQARVEPDDTSTLIDISTQLGGIIISGGKITLRIEAAQTLLLDFEFAVFDLILTAPDGTVTRLVEGKVKISPDVTR